MTLLIPVSSSKWRTIISSACFIIAIFLVIKLNIFCIGVSNNYSIEVEVDELSELEINSGELRLAQDDPKLLNFILHKVLRPPAIQGPVLLSGIDVNFKKTPEQQQVYRFILNLLNNKTKGFFVECGAHDGEFYSNTLPLEMRQQWTGLLVEADPLPLESLLLRNRRAWIAPACLSPHTFPVKVTMKQHKVMTGWTFLNGWGRLNGKAGDYRTFDVQCFPLFSLLKAINVTTVDYFSLDIEGAELAVLKTIPWKDILIRTLSIEVTSENQKELNTYMTSVGYTFVAYIKNTFSHDYIYAHASLNIG